MSSVYADDNKMYANADFDVNVVSNVSGGGGSMGGTTHGLKSFVTNRLLYVTSSWNANPYPTSKRMSHGFAPSQSGTKCDHRGPPLGSSVSLVNASGQVVFEALANDQDLLALTLPHLLKGMYILRSSNGWTERLLIVR